METVMFSMTACQATRGPRGGEELALDFRATHPAADATRLRGIRIGGVQPGALLALQVCAGIEVAFVLEACHDRAGRTVAAGDMLAAIYGLGLGRCLQVASGDFLQPVAMSGAGVQLRLQGVPRAAIDDVTVEGDSW